MKLPFRRTRFWIDPGFQARQLVRSLVHLLFFATLVWLISHILETTQVALGHRAAADPVRLNNPILSAFFVCLPLIVLDILRSSHRVAGPLFRCRKMMLEMAEGKTVAEFRPRKGDEMASCLRAEPELPYPGM